MSQNFKNTGISTSFLDPDRSQASGQILEKHFLREGQLFVTKMPIEIITILGSCVSVCLWDRKMKIGGMNHFLLSDNADAQSLSQGLFATKALVREMLLRKCQKQDLEAKIFGGSSYLQRFEVGKGNIDMSFKVLKEEGIPVAAFHTGGTFGRKIIFRTDTGNVLMRIMKKSLKDLHDEIGK